MRIPLLDRGYVDFVEAWGVGKAGVMEAGIIEAARQSTQGSFRGWGVNGIPGDEKLLAFLNANKHLGPFEFAGMTIEIQAPIMVFREWHRHRTQSYNEMSARYSPLPDVNYIPTVERIMLSGGLNKQAGSAVGADSLTESRARTFRAMLEIHYGNAESVYQSCLKDGVPKELARLCIPVGRYSRMRATANLRNWLAFLTLRMDVAAQWEIRQYANAVGEIIAWTFPRTWELFQLGRIGSAKK